MSGVEITLRLLYSMYTTGVKEQISNVDKSTEQ